MGYLRYLWGWLRKGRTNVGQKISINMPECNTLLSTITTFMKHIGIYIFVKVSIVYLCGEDPYKRPPGYLGRLVGYTTKFPWSSTRCIKIIKSPSTTYH